MIPEYQIRNAVIVDGSGSPGKKGCLDLNNGITEAVGCREHPAQHIIDAEGMIAAPGFIDVHTHADAYVGDFECMKSFLSQGVTTCVTGNCGFSVFPLEGRAGKEHLRYGVPVLGEARHSAGYKSFQEFARQNRSAFVNVAALTGHGALRTNVESRFSNLWESEQMARKLEEQLEEGAAGLSLGLIYYPGSVTKREEFVKLARIVQKHGKVLAVHLRDEGLRICDSMDEMLSLAQETGVHIHFSHHKLMGVKSWGWSEKTLELFRQAKKGGLELSLDAYPYTSGASTAAVLLPPWVCADGMEKTMERLKSRRVLEKIQKELRQDIEGWENLSRSCGWANLVAVKAGPDGREISGKSIKELAGADGCSEVEKLAELIVREQGKLCVAIHGMSQEDVDRIIQFPDTLIGSDGLFGPGAAHPRRYGAFARFLRRYAAEKKVLTLEEAVHKITGLAAETFGIRDRGFLRPGYAADVVIFDQKKISDRSDYQRPEALAEGVKYVFLNGQIVLDNGTFFCKRAGRTLHI